MGKVARFGADITGLTDYAGEERARKGAVEASERADALARDNLQFQKDQYADWKTVYGDIQQNLGEYYKGLGPERVISLGLQEQQRAYQQTAAEVKRSMAQRGLQGSGLETYTQAMISAENYTKRADIRSKAPDVAAQQKLQFLGLGLGQGGQMLGNINNAAGMGVTSSMAHANMYNSQFGILSNNNAAMARTAVETAGEVFGVMAASDERLKTNIKHIGRINGHNIYSYEFSARPGVTHIGVLAQEVEKLVPDAVAEANGTKFVDYSKLF